MKKIRIGNASGYWGDDPQALRRQLRGSIKLDYIVLDYLAEVSMSILQKQRDKDESRGYAADFLSHISGLLKECKEKGVKIITNAGGLNSKGAARELLKLAKEEGINLRVAVVEGDDVTHMLSELLIEGQNLANMDTGESLLGIIDELQCANVYYGATPLVLALSHSPDVVICGRATDTALTLAPLIHEFSWKETEYDLLASGVVAGHILECGAQASGGNFTDWKKVPTFSEIGFPIVEVSEDGTFVVCKHPELGGLVSEQTVREQLMYESADPKNYIVPDVIVDFTTIKLQGLANQKVKISGVRGRAPTDLLKVSVAYLDGYRAQGAIMISGPDAVEKAIIFENLLWQKLDAALIELGLEPVDGRLSEKVGHSACHPDAKKDITSEEVFLRCSVRDKERAKLEVFRKILPGLILSGPAGVTVTGGAPIISEVVGYFPTLMPRSLPVFEVSVLENHENSTKVMEEDLAITLSLHGGIVEPSTVIEVAPSSPGDSVIPPESISVHLMMIAHSRSGDKGDSVNIGLIARSPECYEWLYNQITRDYVMNAFSSMCLSDVYRYELPNLWALNFVLHGMLLGGGTKNLRIDAQGKTLGQAILRQKVIVPIDLFKSIKAENAACEGELWQSI